MRSDKRNNRFPMVLLLVAAVLVGGISVAAWNQQAGAEDAEFTLKFGTVAPAGTPWSEQLTAIKNRVEEESNGRIKFKLYLGGTLGGEVEMVRSCRRNRIQGFGGSTGAISEGAGLKQFDVLELPFMFKSNEEVDFVMDEFLFDPMSQTLDENGFYLAYWHVNGWHNFASNKKAIHTPADLAEHKMRSQESPVHLAMFKALGAQPISMPVPEVLGSLQTGMVDGFSNSSLFTGATGWYEGIKYYTISHHLYQPAAIIYNKEFWDSLPADLQAILLGDRVKETTEGRAAVRAIEPELIEMFKESGIVVEELTEAERVVFEELCAGVPDQFNDTIGAQLINTVKAGVKTYRASH
jgi:TRAP-type C4-dicarboxylate transport system substrate-binding protein